MMIIASILLALMAIVVKSIEGVTRFEILFFQCIPTMIFMPILLKKNKISILGKNKISLLSRGFFGFFSLIAYYYALQKMNVASAVTLLQLSPFFIILLSTVFLNEKSHSFQIPITFLAFIGTLFIVKPGFGFNYFPAIIGVLGALLAAGGQTTVRHLSTSEHPFVVINYLVYIMAFLSLISQLFLGSFVIPARDLLPNLILLGLIYFFAEIAITLAYFYLPASLVSLYKYSQIVFATFFGFVFFHELPDLLSFIGALLIIISGYLNYKYNFIKNKLYI